MNKHLIFLHIPRSGGLTLSEIIKRQYKREELFSVPGSKESINKFKRLENKKRQKIKCVFGHFPFGFHNYFSGKSGYITMLRDPVDRIISHYYATVSRKHHYLHDKVVSENISLKEYVTKGLSFEMSNSQTQLLSGGEKKLALDVNGPESRKYLEIAKKNLVKYFTAVGLTERFDESILLFKKRLGWKNIFYYKINVSKTRPKKRNVSQDAIDIIKKYNQLDIDLYNYAKDIFEKMLEKEDASFKKDLKKFKQMNKIYSSVIYKYKQVRRTLKKLIKKNPWHILKK